MTVIDLATPKLDELDDARATIERLAAANQALTQRLDREHSMRLAAETDRDQWKSAAMMHTAGKVSAWNERDESERRAHEAEAALEALRADVERDRVGFDIDSWKRMEREHSELVSRISRMLSFGREWHEGPPRDACQALAVSSVCELLAAWGRAKDSEHYLSRIRWAANIHRDVKEAIELASDALYGRVP